MRPTATFVRWTFGGEHCIHHYCGTDTLNSVCSFPLRLPPYRHHFWVAWSHWMNYIYRQVRVYCCCLAVLRMLIHMKHGEKVVKEINRPLAFATEASSDCLSGMIGIGGSIILSPCLLLLQWSAAKRAAVSVHIHPGELDGRACAGQLHRTVDFYPEMWLMVTIAFCQVDLWVLTSAPGIPSAFCVSLLAMVLLVASFKLIFALWKVCVSPYWPVARAAEWVRTKASTRWAGKCLIQQHSLTLHVRSRQPQSTSLPMTQLYARPGWPVISDQYPGTGPAGGGMLQRCCHSPFGEPIWYCPAIFRRIDTGTLPLIVATHKPGYQMPPVEWRSTISGSVWSLYLSRLDDVTTKGERALHQMIRQLPHQGGRYAFYPHYHENGISEYEYLGRTTTGRAWKYRSEPLVRWPIT